MRHALFSHIQCRQGSCLSIGSIADNSDGVIDENNNTTAHRQRKDDKTQNTFVARQISLCRFG